MASAAVAMQNAATGFRVPTRMSSTADVHVPRQPRHHSPHRVCGVQPVPKSRIWSSSGNAISRGNPEANSSSTTVSAIAPFPSC